MFKAVRGWIRSNGMLTTVFWATLIGGAVTVSQPSLSKISPYKIQPDLLVSLLADGQLLNIQSHGEGTATGRPFVSQWQSFADLLRDSTAESKTPTLTAALDDLQLSFSHLAVRSLGLGLTYPDHQQETGVDQIVVFQKNAAPTRLNDDMPFRDYLDYELEVSLLLHRTEPGVFGFMLHNDFTDRMIQGMEFVATDPEPSFSKAKSFAGANAHGPIMAVGGDALWASLQAELHWNESPVQTLDPQTNLLKPTDIHKLVFESKFAEGHDWILIGSGTPSGTIFRAPTNIERAYYLSKALFRPAKAKELWVKSFDFTKAEDTLTFSSESLGTFQTRIVR